MKKLFICFVILFSSFFAFSQNNIPKEELKLMIQKYLQSGTYILLNNRDGSCWLSLKENAGSIYITNDGHLRIDGDYFFNKKPNAFVLDENNNLIINNY